MQSAASGSSIISIGSGIRGDYPDTDFSRPRHFSYESVTSLRADIAILSEFEDACPHSVGVVKDFLQRKQDRLNHRTLFLQSEFPRIFNHIVRTVAAEETAVRRHVQARCGFVPGNEGDRCGVPQAINLSRNTAMNSSRNTATNSSRNAVARFDCSPAAAGEQSNIPAGLWTRRWSAWANSPWSPSDGDPGNSSSSSNDGTHKGSLVQRPLRPSLDTTAKPFGLRSTRVATRPNRRVLQSKKNGNNRCFKSCTKSNSTTGELITAEIDTSSIDLPSQKRLRRTVENGNSVSDDSSLNPKSSLVKTILQQRPLLSESQEKRQQKLSSLKSALKSNKENSSEPRNDTCNETGHQSSYTRNSTALRKVQRSVSPVNSPSPSSLRRQRSRKHNYGRHNHTENRMQLRRSSTALGSGHKVTKSSSSCDDPESSSGPPTVRQNTLCEEPEKSDWSRKTTSKTDSSTPNKLCPESNHEADTAALLTVIWTDVETEVEYVSDRAVDTETDSDGGRPATRCSILDCLDGLPHPFWGIEVEQSSWVSIPNPSKLDPECKVLSMLRLLAAKRPQDDEQYNSVLLVRHYKPFLKYGIFPSSLYELLSMDLRAAEAAQAAQTAQMVRNHAPTTLQPSSHKTNSGTSLKSGEPEGCFLSQREDSSNAVNSTPGAVSLGMCSEEKLLSTNDWLTEAKSPNNRRAFGDFEEDQDTPIFDQLPHPVDPTWRNVYCSRLFVLQRPLKRPVGAILKEAEEWYRRNQSREETMKTDVATNQLQTAELLHRTGTNITEKCNIGNRNIGNPNKKAELSPLTSEGVSDRCITGYDADYSAAESDDDTSDEESKTRDVNAPNYLNSKDTKASDCITAASTCTAENGCNSDMQITYRNLQQQQQNVALPASYTVLQQRQKLKVRRGRRIATANMDVVAEGREWLRFHQKRVVLGPSDWADRIKPPPVPVPRSVTALRRGSTVEAPWPALIPTIFRGPSQYEDLQEALLHILWGKKEGLIPTPRRTNLKIWGGGFMTPHDDKRYRRGDDSWFSSEPLSAFGVCDGVGEMGDSEWRVAGFDCRGFGEDVLREAKQRVLSIRLSELPLPATRPRLVREPGTRRSQNRWVPVNYTVSTNAEQPSLIALDAMVAGYYGKRTTWGAATCLIGCMNKEGNRLGFANIGDSRAVVLRRGRFSTGSLTIVGATQPEQHGWNLPVQLARLPDRAKVKEMRKDGRLQELVRTLDSCRATGQDVNDKPETATLFDFDVQEGDLIVLASDGLWDNVFDVEVANLCGIALSPLESKTVCGSVFKSTAPRDVAKGLCLAAYWKSLHPNIETPFSQSVRDAEGAGYHHLGGKRDDISVVCAWVVGAELENNIHLLQRWRVERQQEEAKAQMAACF